MTIIPVRADIPLKAEVPTNAEGKLPPGLIRTALTIDAVGGARQATAGTSAILGLAGNTAGACFVSSSLIPPALLITGPLTTALAVKYAIPEALEQLAEANEHVREAKACFNQPLDVEKRSKASFALDEAKRVLKIAKLGMFNQSLLLSMGLGQTATGTVAMLTVPPAFLCYAPVLTGAAATTAIFATSVALSAIYFVRGATMVYRAKQNLNVINGLAEELRAQKNVQEAMELMKGMEALGPDYLKRRMDVSCLGGMSAVGCKTPGDEKEYLRRVDKAIYSQALKHKVAMCIGFAMIIGAVLGIIAINLASGGIPLLLVSLGSALFFVGVEVPFLVYDSSKLFTKFRDFWYARREVVEFKDAPEAVRVSKWLPASARVVDNWARMKSGFCGF